MHKKCHNCYKKIDVEATICPYCKSTFSAASIEIDKLKAEKDDMSVAPCFIWGSITLSISLAFFFGDEEWVPGLLFLLVALFLLPFGFFRIQKIKKINEQISLLEYNSQYEAEPQHETPAPPPFDMNINEPKANNDYVNEEPEVKRVVKLTKKR